MLKCYHVSTLKCYRFNVLKCYHFNTLTHESATSAPTLYRFKALALYHAKVPACWLVPPPPVTHAYASCELSCAGCAAGCARAIKLGRSSSRKLSDVLTIASSQACKRKLGRTLNVLIGNERG